MCKIESVRVLIESRASNAEIEAAYERATGRTPHKKTIRLWRTQAGCGLPRGVRHDLIATQDTSDVAVVQALVKKYWNPTNGNPLLC